MERWKTIIEPFRIKSVEPVRLTTVAERQQKLPDGNVIRDDRRIADRTGAHAFANTIVTDQITRDLVTTVPVPEDKCQQGDGRRRSSSSAAGGWSAAVDCASPVAGTA